jgi:hypothetical protein
VALALTGCDVVAVGTGHEDVDAVLLLALPAEPTGVSLGVPKLRNLGRHVLEPVRWEFLEGQRAGSGRQRHRAVGVGVAGVQENSLVDIEDLGDRADHRSSRP